MMKLKKFDSGMHYVIVNDDLIAPFLSKNIKRVMCKINEIIDFHCAIMHKKEGGFFINIGSTICKKLNLNLGDDVTLSFEEDTTEYQFEMPETLTEVFFQDPDAFAIFDGLTDGNKRGLIYLVNAVKSSEKQIERALKITEKLKLGITKPPLMLK